MPEYRRNRVPGGTYFFTVNLADRRSDLLVREIETLRTAIRAVRRTAPFHVDAWVVLPDHMHCIWTLPEGDTDYSGRWRAITTSRPMPLHQTDQTDSPLRQTEANAYAETTSGNTRAATNPIIVHRELPAASRGQ